MNILIVDDDFKFCTKLKQDLIVDLSDTTDTINFVIQSSHFDEIEMSNKYDLIFMDIELLEENGIELVKRLKSINSASYITFVSSKLSLVFDALMTRPFYFIRKSFYEHDLTNFLNLFKQDIENEKLIELNYKYVNSIIIVKKIIYLEIEVHRLSFQTVDGISYDNRSLKEIMNYLDENIFVRVHKSFVVNLNEIKHIKKQEIVMNDGTHIPIGRKYQDEFKCKYEEFLLC